MLHDSPPPVSIPKSGQTSAIGIGGVWISEFEFVNLLSARKRILGLLSTVSIRGQT